MPELERATTVSRTKRGYRKISMALRLAEWEVIAKMAEVEDRTPDQQALHMLRRLISEIHTEAIKDAYRNAATRRALADDAEEGTEDDPDNGLARDPDRIDLGSVTRTE